MVTATAVCTAISPIASEVLVDGRERRLRAAADDLRRTTLTASGSGALTIDVELPA